ncbi:energy-coupling factor transporter transmembrane component T family protein [Aquibacillus albus]|uniref:Energy-coupling factor transport system permease protein n=1 Tax=Aquibacillus albus TaxID=1168171 RepID=A0ABS2MXV9_9BACI|nr:energy-coupling factor transporter transmembrane component T [Aquibacillus albus]MBM7570724.1 energy-coupling factor transport system permease protein [Aquibacillus albus]
MNSMYVQGNSFLHQLDPRTKILFVFSIILFVFLFYDPMFQFLVTVSLLPIVFLSGLTTPYLKTVKFMFLLVFLIITVHGLYNPMGDVTKVTWQLTENLSFKHDALIYGAVMSFRILSIGTATLLFVMSTHPSDLANALVKWKVPHAVAFMILSTFQLIPIIGREAKVIMEAQQARCLDVKANMIQRVKHLIPLFAPLFITSFMRVHQMSQVLECRGFSSTGPKTSLREMTIGFRDYAFLTAIALFALAAITLRAVVGGTLLPITDFVLMSALIGIWIVCSIYFFDFLWKSVRKKVV